MIVSTKSQTTPMVEMSEDMRGDIITYLKQMVEELEDPTRTFLDTRFVHRRDDESGYILTIKLNNLFEKGHPAICDQLYRENIAEMLKHQAERIRNAENIPLFVEGNHNRPAKFIGDTPCHDGNEEFNFRVIFERPPGKPIGVEKTPVSLKEKNDG